MSVVKPGYSEGRHTQRRPQCRMSHTGLQREREREREGFRGNEQGAGSGIGVIFDQILHYRDTERHTE